MDPNSGQNEWARKWLEEQLTKKSLQSAILQIAYGGFDTYEDYEKYGDSFVFFRPPPVGSGTQTRGPADSEESIQVHLPPLPEERYPHPSDALQIWKGPGEE